MKNFFSNDVRKRQRTPFLILCCSVFTLLIGNPQTQAAAPTRAKPYVESRCNTDPNVFFCEDFEGEDIVNYGSNNCNSTWGNPAIQKKDICWAGGGSYQHNTQVIPGFSATNRVWRATKTQSFVDIVTGRNTGTGPGTIAGWLNPSLLGTGAHDFYVRTQVWFSPDTTFPDSYDFKMFYALPSQFVDPPSAVYETGLALSRDVWCSGAYYLPSGQNFNDVPTVRYGKQYDRMPYQNEFCPTLSPGQSANGVNAPRLQKGRWYTLEYHVKLANNSTGVLELWVDGKQAYHSQRNTCPNGCPDLGYIMILGWMNGADKQTGYYETDNIVMSRRYIGPPTGGSSSTLPSTPGNLSVTAP